MPLRIAFYLALLIIFASATLADDTQRVHSAWSCTYGGFARVENFGHIVFTAKQAECTIRHPSATISPCAGTFCPTAKITLSKAACQPETQAPAPEAFSPDGHRRLQIRGGYHGK